MPLEKFWESLATYNAPQIIAALVVVAILALMVVVRHLSAPGTDKLAASQSERSEALEAFERIVERQNERIEKLEEQLTKDRRYEQDYRHALNSRMQGFILGFDVARELLVRVSEQWAEMPTDMRAMIRQLPTSAEIDERHPMPKRADG